MLLQVKFASKSTVLNTEHKNKSVTKDPSFKISWCREGNRNDNVQLWSRVIFVIVVWTQSYKNTDHISDYVAYGRVRWSDIGTAYRTMRIRFFVVGVKKGITSRRQYGNEK